MPRRAGPRLSPTNHAGTQPPRHACHAKPGHGQPSLNGPWPTKPQRAKTGRPGQAKTSLGRTHRTGSFLPKELLHFRRCSDVETTERPVLLRPEFADPD